MAFLLVWLSLLVSHGFEILGMILITAYPCYKSIKAIELTSEAGELQKKFWLSFWCVFALAQAWELTIGIVLAYIIPFYGVIKVVFFFYLMMP